ncbi:uncharacterized protein LOC142564384 [Dermacentor variabilis]|uniref:uncharacterized protein LOC142564384 n=1 Tax=Dermacentor variabilis TaxID=34621 RepID=UPI003F5C9C77
MMTTDIIRELGEDPDKVCGHEDHIVLKLENPWPTSTSSSSSLTLPQLPKGLSLNGDGHRITTTSDAFMENRSFLCEHRVVGALFAGCASFDECRPLGAAARAVLSDVQTLVIVHNRDFVRTLVDFFRSVEVLVLHHDMRLQMPEDEWGDIGGAPPQLKRLIGSTPALGAHNLFLSAATICGLLGDCPYLCELQTSMHEILSPANPLVSMLLAARPSLLTTWNLILGADVERLDGTTGVVWDITPGHMVQANMFFRSLRRIEVTTTHSQTIAAIGIFEQLTDVSLMFIAQGTLCSFQGLVENTLKRLQLKHLSLKFVKDISLLAVAEHWPRLQTLSLAECSVVDYDIDDILPGSFAGLVKLRLGSEITIRSLEALLGATRRLVSLRLEGNLLVTSFVIRSSLGSLPRLERLVLGTKQSLPALILTGNDLRYLIKALPALQYVATDSYDLRVFFENYMPWVTLGWGQCTTCAAEFPRVDETQREFWQKAVTPIKRGR